MCLRVHALNDASHLEHAHDICRTHYGCKHYIIISIIVITTIIINIIININIRVLSLHTYPSPSRLCGMGREESAGQPPGRLVAVITIIISITAMMLIVVIIRLHSNKQ